MVTVDEFVRNNFGEESEDKYIKLLERSGFLSSASVGPFDYEVRVFIIQRLARIGGEKSIPILEEHEKLYSSSELGGAEIMAACKHSISEIRYVIENKK